MNHVSFWSRYAGHYDRFLRKNAAAYREMIELICQAVKGKAVLELATGTGPIAKGIVHHAKMIEATDNSPEMIEQAKRGCNFSKLHFSVQDMFSLSYADKSFPVIIAANVLHVIPNPEKALDEIRRVLTADGLLIVPTFTHGDSGFFAKWKARIMGHIGFPLQHRWSSKEYLSFLESNCWRIIRTVSIKASFPLTYVECVKEDFHER